MFRKENTQKIIAIFLAFQLHVLGFFQASADISTHLEIEIIAKLAMPVLCAIFFALFFLAICHTVHTTTWPRLLVTLFMLLAFLLIPAGSLSREEYSWTKWTEIIENPTYIFWIFSFSAFLLSDQLRDLEYFSNILEKFALVTVFLFTFWYLLALSKETAPEYMAFSYSVLFPTVFLLIRQLSNPRPLTLIPGIIGAILILAGGCRGALLAMIICLVVYFLLSANVSTLNKLIIIMITAAFCVLLIMFWQPILEAIADILKELNISSRTLEMIIDQEFLNDSERQKILQNLSDSINATGLGLYSDRALLEGVYVHNILIEIILDFGLPLGILMLILLISTIVLGLSRADHVRKMILCAALSVGVVKLMLSSSYLNWEPGFYLLLGLSVNSIRKDPTTSVATEPNEDVSL